jgi:hypothetical protein
MGTTRTLVVAILVVGLAATTVAVGQSGRGYPTRAPFTAVRWKDSTPEVKVKEDCYQFVAIDDVTAKDLVAFCKAKEKKHWKKRFEEDLVEMMDRMGHKPGDTVTLRVRDLATEKEKVLKDVAMTEENRRAVREAREREE